MKCRLVQAARPSPQQGTAANKNSAGTQHRHPNSANGARPERASKYILLAPAEPAGDPDAARTQVRGNSHRNKRGAEDQG